VDDGVAPGDGPLDGVVVGHLQGHERHRCGRRAGGRRGPVEVDDVVAAGGGEFDHRPADQPAPAGDRDPHGSPPQRYFRGH
jgi:hypothetical protein